MGRLIESEFEPRDFYPIVRKMWHLLWFQQDSCKKTRKNELKKDKPLFTEYSVTENLAVLPNGQEKMIQVLLCAVKNQSKLSIQVKAGWEITK